MSISALKTPAKYVVDYWQHQAWRNRWTRLANDRSRMRAMGGLQSQMDYVQERAQRANRRIASIMRDHALALKLEKAKGIAEAQAHAAEEERANANDGQMNADAENYHRVMQLLADSELPHGLCQPRERKACSHCNAADELARMRAEYKGVPVALCQA